MHNISFFSFINCVKNNVLSLKDKVNKNLPLLFLVFLRKQTVLVDRMLAYVWLCDLYFIIVIGDARKAIIRLTIPGVMFSKISKFC